MPKAGKRYPLLIYTRMMDRWWPALFVLALPLLAFAWWFYQDLFARITQPWKWMTMAGVGGLVLLASVLTLAMRQSAYVRAFSDHLLLATPFLRMNVSYRRIQRTTTVGVATLFPTRNMSFLKRDAIEPLLSQTAVVIDLNSLPISRSALRLFLSPFFFKDQTPHLVIIVRDWMGFSTELESLRSASGAPDSYSRQNPGSLLSQLPRK